MPRAKLSIVLANPVPGHSIIAAVKTICGENEDDTYEETKQLIDGKTLFSVGRNSKYSYKDNILKVGHDVTEWIDPDALYSIVAVEDYERSGMEYAVPIEFEDTINAVKNFHAALRDELSKLTKIEEVKIHPKSIHQEDDCLVCGGTATLQADYLKASIRCCDRKSCVDEASAIARA